MIPIEWLNELIQSRDGYRRLLSTEGSLSAAAYRLALAKCMSWEQSTHVPSRSELRAAAREIARKIPGTAVPETSTLVRDCEALGLFVI
jgi:hypothetical protein